MNILKFRCKFDICFLSIYHGHVSDATRDRQLKSQNLFISRKLGIILFSCTALREVLDL